MSESEMPINPDREHSMGRNVSGDQDAQGMEAFLEEHELQEISSLMKTLIGTSKKSTKSDESEESEETKEVEKEIKAREGQGATVAESQQSQSAQARKTAKSIVEHLANPGSPGSPNLPRDNGGNPRDIPTDATGTANPWLEGSKLSELFLAFFDLAPILMQIKIQEVETQADAMMQQMDMAVESAKQAMKAKKLEAEKLVLDAVEKFVSAAISIGMLTLIVANEMKNQVPKKTPPPTGSGENKGGLNDSANQHRTQTDGARGQTSTTQGTGGQQPKGDPGQAMRDQHRFEQRTQMMNQAFQGIVSGTIALAKAQKTIEQGKAEFASQLLSKQADLFEKAGRYAEREIEAAGKQLSSLVDALNKIVQAHKMFGQGIR